MFFCIDNEVGDEGIKILSKYLYLMKNKVGDHIRVSLSGMNMKNDGIRYIGEYILQIADIDELNLDYNGIEDDGLIELSKYCVNLPNLARLTLDCIYIFY